MTEAPPPRGHLSPATDGPDGEDDPEDASPTDGTENSVPHLRAALSGVYDSLRSKRLRPPEDLPETDLAQSHPSWYKSGHVIGTAIQAGVILYGLLAAAGVEVLPL